MQNRREENQIRLADIARSIEELSTELNRRLLIEGEYLIQESATTGSALSPIVAVRAEPLDLLIQAEEESSPTRQVHRSNQGPIGTIIEGVVEPTEVVQPIIENPDEELVNRPITRNEVEPATRSDSEIGEFRNEDFVVITNRYLNLKGRRGTIKQVTRKFVVIELEFSTRRISRKKTNVRLLHREL